MRFPLSMLFAAGLCLAGCGSLHRSPTWAAVISTRVDTRGATDPSEEYATHLSGVLKSSHIEHKVVGYEFRYRTRLREEAIGTRTAVVYRDTTNPRNPWWLMDERLRIPVWLPGNDLDHQISFYLRRPITVVSVNGQNVNGDGKAQIATGSESPTLFARLSPIRHTERSRPFVAPARPVSPSNVSARYLSLFRARNRGTFDPASVADRLKMDRIVHPTRRSVAQR